MEEIKSKVKEFIEKKQKDYVLIRKKVDELWDKVKSVEFDDAPAVTFVEVLQSIGYCDSFLNSIDGMKLGVVNVKNALDTLLDEVGAFKDYVFNWVLLHGSGSTVADRKSNAYIVVNDLVNLKVELKSLKNEVVGLEKKLTNWENLVSRKRRDLYNKRKEYQEGILKQGYENSQG